MASKTEILTKIERKFPDLIILAYLNDETTMAKVNDLLWPLFEMGDSQNEVAREIAPTVVDSSSTEPELIGHEFLVQESFAQWSVRPRD